jgi:hypothetical protein
LCCFVAKQSLMLWPLKPQQKHRSPGLTSRACLGFFGAAVEVDALGRGVTDAVGTLGPGNVRIGASLLRAALSRSCSTISSYTWDCHVPGSKLTCVADCLTRMQYNISRLQCVCLSRWLSISSQWLFHALYAARDRCFLINGIRCSHASSHSSRPMSCSSLIRVPLAIASDNWSEAFEPAVTPNDILA